MNTPKPHDPRELHVTPEQLKQRVDDIYSEPVESLAQEAEQLGRVHQLLHEALQS